MKEIKLTQHMEKGLLKIGSVVRKIKTPTKSLTIGKNYTVCGIVDKGSYVLPYIINDKGRRTPIYSFTNLFWEVIK